MRAIAPAVSAYKMVVKRGFFAPDVVSEKAERDGTRSNEPGVDRNAPASIIA